jgi:glycosyltransferase involved in cell wall biosynthesis
MAQKLPKVSVIMATYNASAFLEDSIESILDQTLKDFEFIIVDDCSTDLSWDILSRYQALDRRIVLLKNQENCGPAASRNRALEFAQGDYIAVLDSDDIALKHRLEKQLLYMESHSDVGMISSGVEYIDKNGQSMGIFLPPKSSLLLRWKLIYSNPVRHSTAFWRRQSVNDLVGVYDSVSYAEDYDFFVRISRVLKIISLPLVLVKMRQSSGSLSFAKGHLQDHFGYQVSNVQISHYLEHSNLNLSEQEKINLWLLLRRYSPRQDKEFEALSDDEVYTASCHIICLFEHFLLRHQNESSVFKVWQLFASLETRLAQIIKLFIANGKFKLAANLFSVYLETYPLQLSSMTLKLLIYLAYSKVKRLPIYFKRKTLVGENK